ncbi:Abscisic acid-insensitive 5-like protein [Thalictrum thalictroides]|uniref:Abscisic acid-insensitive 5-like protein n=1 Tax=Thalictrum thalictroides TaxID=46969 RepID=A0A7J6WJZ9_THATH|nr:Abscisic acid-insensitive 5-like protein [Thalictrum thalictroides]
MVSPNRVQPTPLPHFPAPATTITADADATQASFSSTIYNLAFNEVQTQLGQLGKPINRMNLDEILKTVINTSGVGVAGGGTTGMGEGEGGVVDSINDNIDLNKNHHDHNALSPSLSSSSSSSSSSPVPFNFTQAIKSEVWREVVQQDQSSNVGVGTGSSSNNNEEFVQTTLEDFLIRHGGFDVDDVNTQPLATMSQSTEWLQFPQPVAASLLADSVVDVGYSDHQLVSSMPMVVSTSSGVQPASERKRRFSDEMMDKTIERKQKRMVKNRESAARSRQRKQEHIKSLEHMITSLRKENQSMKEMIIAVGNLSVFLKEILLMLTGCFGNLAGARNKDIHLALPYCEHSNRVGRHVVAMMAFVVLINLRMGE